MRQRYHGNKSKALTKISIEHQRLRGNINQEHRARWKNIWEVSSLPTLPTLLLCRVALQSTADSTYVPTLIRLYLESTLPTLRWMCE